MDAPRQASGLSESKVNLGATHLLLIVSQWLVELGALESEHSRSDRLTLVVHFVSWASLCADKFKVNSEKRVQARKKATQLQLSFTFYLIK